MAAIKLLNLLALSSLVILACSFGATPANAVSVDHAHNLARNQVRGHDAMAKRKRASTSKRCKPRPITSSLASAAPVTTAAPVTSVKAEPKPEVKPTTTPAPAPPAPSPKPPSNTGGGGGKVGIAWPNGDDAALANFKTNKVSYIYTWSAYLPSKAKSLGFNAIPMLWGAGQVADFQRLVVKGYADTVLGFNEPDHAGQANLSPQRAADLWRQYINPLKDQGYRLISPAVTSAPAGKQWMKDFFGACSGCHFDGLALHWYGTSAKEFTDYLVSFHNDFGLDIWVTEFACQNFAGGSQCSRDQVFSFMSTVKGFMDSTPWVASYFAFGVMHNMVDVNPLNQLMSSNGFPTDLGYLYVN